MEEIGENMEETKDAKPMVVRAAKVSGNK